jgi:hypothetical protein
MVAVKVEDGAAERVDCGEVRGGVVVGSIIFMAEECKQ